MKYTSIALADTIMTRYPDPDTIPYKVWCYVQGYFLAGFEMLWQHTGDDKYWQYVKRWVDQHVNEDGDMPGVNPTNMDDIMAGCMILALYEHTGQEKYRRAADKIRLVFDEYPRNSDGGFWHSRKLPYEMWIDGVFMGGMFLARYGAIMGDAYCFDELTRQIIVCANRCRKGDSGLFLHAYDESKSVEWADPKTGLSCDVWSEGLGWYALILVETLKVLPDNHVQRVEVQAILIELIEGLVKVQDAKTGLWYQVVDKGDRADNWHDTSGSAMFVYCIQKAIDLGYIEAETYAPLVKKGYDGIVSKARLNDEGLIDIVDACDGVCVQISTDVYINYPKKINAKEAIGGVLWATTVVEKPPRNQSQI